MSYANRWWITYNGELYNFRDFRRELELSGKRFNAECDNEVLLRMFVVHLPLIGRLEL
jgi:asparagine synthase (glutamine-hydrolysing)